MTAPTGARAGGRVGRAGAAVAGGEVLAKLLVLVRNAVVAQLISREDFGLAATYALVVTGLELFSEFGVNQLVVQDDEGDDPGFQAAAQLWNLARGVVVALVLLLVAPWIAGLFNAPEATTAFRLLAVVPLARGLMHLDVVRWTRTLRFGPSVSAYVGAEVAATITAIALAWWLRDARAILASLLVRHVLFSVITQLLADRPYRVARDPATFNRILAFGWPLLLNGVVLFAMLQGDRLVVGAAYDLSALGGYSVAFGLATMPTLLLARVNRQLLLPVLSRRQGDDAAFLRAYRSSTDALALVASLLAVFFLTVGPDVQVLLYGDQYTDVGVLLGIIGVMQALRLVRAAPSQAAMARGETQNTLQANIARFVGLGVVVVLASRQAPLEWLAWAGVGAELVATVTAVVLLRRTHGIARRTTFAPLLRGAAVPAAVAVVVAVLDPGTAARLGLAVVAGLATTVVATTHQARLWLLAEVRRLRAARRNRATVAATHDDEPTATPEGPPGD